MEKALFFYGEMLAAGVAPNVFTYSALLTACAKERQWKKAFQVSVKNVYRNILERPKSRVWRNSHYAKMRKIITRLYIFWGREL